MPLKTYEAASVLINCNGIDLNDGIAADTFLTIEPLSDDLEATFGSDGKMALSKLANKGATISLTLQQTSETNRKIAAVSAAQNVVGAIPEVSVFTVLDLVGESNHFITNNAVLMSRPGHSFGSSSGDKTWTWVCESYIETDNPASVTAAISKYLK